MIKEMLKERVCIVTGANRGLGYCIAEGLAQLGATVVLACRDWNRGRAAVESIQSLVRDAKLDLMPLDLSLLQSVRMMAEDFCAKYNRLDVLINNAAIFTEMRQETSDGFEMMFATNHLGPFLLTNLLLDRLKASGPSRVVNVTAPSTTELDFYDLQGELHFNPYHAFGASKMCNLLSTYMLADRLRGRKVTVNAVHPGPVKTDLMNVAPVPMRWFSDLVSSPPEKAALSPLYVACSPKVAHLTGKFFKDKQVITSCPYSHNPDVQRRLWELSAALVGIESLRGI